MWTIRHKNAVLAVFTQKLFILFFIYRKFLKKFIKIA